MPTFLRMMEKLLCSVELKNDEEFEMNENLDLDLESLEFV